ncbi:hypothetical protein NDU88_003280 [Pleurodeles waltl]|uniref:Uncharacterized protein n=1 Tax=Pleurodeles waltl TaxID=8319 RepID=A0AAV7M6I2_PLEWA|nr:hypothetical protein NDU88_003280 [Pleurodeles waltl]
MKVVVRGSYISSKVGVWTQLHSEIKQQETVMNDLCCELEETPEGREHMLDEKKKLFDLIVASGQFDYRAYVDRAHAER